MALIRYPFTLKNKGREIFYGYEENVSHHTNIGDKIINLGERFTYQEDGPEYVYKITHIHPYK